MGLARVVIRSGGGSLSRLVVELAPSQRAEIQRATEELPERVGLLSLRNVVPVMASLGVRRELNYLNAEALAVAYLTSSEVLLSTDSPLLRDGAVDIGVTVRVVK